MKMSSPEELAKYEHHSEFGDFVIDMNVSQIAQYGDIDSDYDDGPLYFSTTYKTVGVSVGCVILALGIAMNCLLITVLKKCTSMFIHATASSLCRLLIYLAVADNLVLGSSCIMHIVELFLIFNQWVYGSAGCTMLVFIQYFSQDVVGVATLLLAIERYAVYTQSQRFQMPVRRTTVTVFLGSALAVIFCSPWIALSKTVIREYHDIPDNIIVEECSFNVSVASFSWYYLFDSILFYFLPLFCGVLLYLLMFSRFHKMQLAMDRQKEDSERQVYRMLFISTVVMFGLAVLPFRILVLFNVFAEEKFLNLWFFLFARLIMYAGSALKPVVYLMFSQQFRRGFRNVVFCRNAEEDNLNLEMEAVML